MSINTLPITEREQLKFNNMAIPWAAIASGGSGLGSSIISASATQKANHDARNFALMQGDIEWQRNNEAWARDNHMALENWNRQNQYNSPLAQMERFREAGLNPNLIYGQTNTGGSIATGSPGTPGRPANWRPDPVKFDLQNGILAYLNAREQQARTDNMLAQREVLQQEVALKGAQIGSLVGQTAKTKFELDVASELKGTSVDAAKANLRKTQIESSLMVNRDTREELMNASNLQEAGVRMAKMAGETLTGEMQRKLMEMEIELKQMGLQWNDPLLLRVIGGEIKKWFKYEDNRENDRLYFDFKNR